MRKARITIWLFNLFAVLIMPAAAQTPPPGPPDRRGELGADEVIRVNTALVSLPVIVSDREGRYVPGLRPDDFQVLEDGVEQQVSHFATTETPFVVALLLDTSGSARLRLREMQEAAASFVEGLRPGDKVAVVSFGGKVELRAGPTNDRELLRRAIRSVPLGNSTPLYDAVDFVLRRLFDGVVGRKAVVLLSDGLDNGSATATYVGNMHDAEESEVLIYPVQYDPFVKETRAFTTALGRPPELRSERIYPPGFNAKDYEKAGRYLREMALRTGGRYYHADGAATVKRAFKHIAEELRFQYSLGYYPKAAPEPSRRRAIKVKVRNPNLSVRTRSSYIYKQPVK
jgi:Ca-activated chloride channel family protein